MANTNQADLYKDILTESRITAVYHRYDTAFADITAYDAVRLFYMAAHINDSTPLKDEWYRLCSHERLKVMFGILNDCNTTSFLKRGEIQKFAQSRFDGVYMNSKFFRYAPDIITHQDLDYDVVYVTLPTPLICSAIYQIPAECLHYFGMWLLSLRFLNPSFNILTTDVMYDEAYHAELNNYPQPLCIEEIGELCNVQDCNSAAEFLKRPITINMPYNTRKVRLYNAKKMKGWSCEGIGMPFEILLPPDLLYGCMVRGIEPKTTVKEWSLGTR